MAFFLKKVCRHIFQQDGLLKRGTFILSCQGVDRSDAPLIVSSGGLQFNTGSVPVAASALTR